MQELQELAKKLLSEGRVQVVIGYEAGAHGVRPAFVTDAADCGRLIFDPRCVHNLAVYLSPRRSPVKRLGKPAVVVKGCDAKAVAGLLRESQIKRDDVVLIGVRCSGVLADPRSGATLTGETVADKCILCDLHEPTLVDHLVGELRPPLPDMPRVSRRDLMLERISAMSPAERWAFWQAEFSRCTRCYACRQTCPLCFCEQCVADKSQPQWLETSPHPRGNLAWHVIRAMHLAGRCVDCGECERACPAEIPLGLLYRKVAQIVEARFKHRPTEDPEVPSPIGKYSLDDEQEFIL
ncbi:MAG: 4Fe-4S dicluster domain-containing protein [Bradymonadales bacterium]|nr:4Fe-4S dicluster domain-containing protein [Bradymonadales bacterium]